MEAEKPASKVLKRKAPACKSKKMRTLYNLRLAREAYLKSRCSRRDASGGWRRKKHETTFGLPPPCEDETCKNRAATTRAHPVTTYYICAVCRQNNTRDPVEHCDVYPSLDLMENANGEKTRVAETNFLARLLAAEWLNER
jgi:hypothetical protein